MTSMSNYFSRLEAHQNLEVAIIRATKINKVLKMIVKLSSIPRDEEFQFRKRAVDMLSQWKNDLELDTSANPEDKDDSNKAAETEDKKDDGEEAQTEPKANGSHNNNDENDGNKEDSNEPLDEPMTDADAAVSKEGGDKGEEKTEEKAEEKTEEKASESKAEDTKAAA